MSNIPEKDTAGGSLYKEEYSRLKNMVEAHIDRYIPDVDKRSGILYDAMKYSVDAGGKRLRPVLLLAACEAAGGDAAEALPFACAIEFIHTYSLIHDDHPSMDNDDLRRGKPTNHKVFGDDIAILAGDGLLNSGMDVMLEAVMAEADDALRERKLRASYEISRAAGVRGMVAGQTADVMMTGGGLEEHRKIYVELSEDQKPDMLRYIHRNKTGALIRASVRAGAVIGGASDNELEAFTDYAEKIGLVFQIVDDILDVVGDEDITGKKTGMDADLGKLTYPAVFGLEKSYEFAAIETQAAVDALKNGSQVSSDFLEKLALDLQNRIS